MFIGNATGGSKKIYGVKFDSDGNGIRTYDAKDLVFEPSILETTAGIDDFIDTDNGNSPFHIRECLSQYNSSTGKQEVIAYEGDDGYRFLRNSRRCNVMIEFPKFYYKRAGDFEWLVSSHAINGFSPSPMHYRNGVMHDYLYHARYYSDANFMSRPGATVKVNTTLEQFRTGFRNIGMYCVDYATLCSINMLMLIKYCTLDVSSLIGSGGSYNYNTGKGDAILGKDGTTNINGGSNIIMGIEGYCNTYLRITDGIFTHNDEVFINTDIENITTNPSYTNHPGYVKCPNVSLVNSNGDYIAEFSHDSEFPWAFLCKTTSDSSSSINDGIWTSITSNTDNVCLAGGDRINGADAGPFCMDLTYDGLGVSNTASSAFAFFLS